MRLATPPGAPGPTGPVPPAAPRGGARLAEPMDALVVAGRRFLLHRHPDIDELVDAIDVLDEDERIPYWAELWPSSIALAQFLLQHPAQVLGLRAIELGCGLGLAGLAAAAAGARVLATDYDRDAVRFARRNAQANGLAVSHALMDWRQPIARGTFPIVLAADILYEGRFLVPVWRALDALLTPRGSALVSEPGREVAQPFFDLLRREGWRVKRETVEKVANGKAPPAVVTVWRVQRPAG